MTILVDLHTHTITSGHAYSTISENALAASRKGLQLLGMTDHGPSMLGAPSLYHFGNLSILPEELYGVRLLPGIEANIISHEGELDLPVNYLVRMKLVLAGLHVQCYPGGTIEQNTQAYINAMKNPFTDMMVHPGRPEFELDLEKVAYMAAQLNVPVEINNSSLASGKKETQENCHRFAGYMAKYKGPVILGSDAHFWDRVGVLDRSLHLAQEVGIKEEQIFNTSPERVLAYLEERRQKRFTAKQ
ncbi:phosphatase [Desulfosporosinus acidiphilus]|uniref:phosphatase n=1 Tax=Desulfosporosinus acidiphilus TaxID=885581 RepID=UPI00059E728E|nr:phosphatase [Desulfosporosinus acidiphilus]